MTQAEQEQPIIIKDAQGVQLEDTAAEGKRDLEAIGKRLSRFQIIIDPFKPVRDFLDGYEKRMQQPVKPKYRRR